MIQEKKMLVRSSGDREACSDLVDVVSLRFLKLGPQDVWFSWELVTREKHLSITALSVIADGQGRHLLEGVAFHPDGPPKVSGGVACRFLPLPEPLHALLDLTIVKKDGTQTNCEFRAELSHITTVLNKFSKAEVNVLKAGWSLHVGAGVVDGQVMISVGTPESPFGTKSVVGVAIGSPDYTWSSVRIHEAILVDVFQQEMKIHNHGSELISIAFKSIVDTPQITISFEDPPPIPH